MNWPTSTKPDKPVACLFAWQQVTEALSVLYVLLVCYTADRDICLQFGLTVIDIHFSKLAQADLYAVRKVRVAYRVQDSYAFYQYCMNLWRGTSVTHQDVSASVLSFNHDWTAETMSLLIDKLHTHLFACFQFQGSCKCTVCFIWWTVHM